MTSRTTPADGIRISANLVLAVAQAATPGLPALGIGTSIGERSDATPALVTPPGFAFSVWGPIFVGMALYAVYQALPARRADPRLRIVGTWTALAMAVNTLWVLHVVLSGITALSVVIIVALLAGLLGALLAEARAPAVGLGWTLLVRAPIGLFAGWITAASIANAASWLGNGAGYDGTPLAPGTWVAVLAVVGALAAAAVLRATRGNPFYAATFLWALGTIAIKMSGLGETVALTGCLVGIAIVLAVALAARRAPALTAVTRR